MDSEPRTTRDELRARIRTARARLDPAWRTEAAERLRARLTFPDGWIAGYIAIRGEPVVHTAVPAGRLVLPRTTAAGLVFHAWDGSAFIPGQLGVPEPDVRLPVVDPREIACWLVPGVVFDRAGNRLGYGKGHYDRVLAGTPGQKIGIAWEMQVVTEVPAEPHDVRMDTVVTEEGAWWR